MNHQSSHLNLSSNINRKLFQNYFSLFSYRSDVKLYKDDAEIKYSKTLDSCKIPQVKQITSFYVKINLFSRRFDMQLLNVYSNV
jgi:hypothetical protein